VTLSHREKYALQYGTPPEAVSAVLLEGGFALAQRFDAGELQLREDVYASPDRRAAIRYIRDHFVHIDVLVIEAVDGATLTDWYHRLVSRLEMFGAQALADLARSQDMVSRSFGLRGLAATQSAVWISAYEAIRVALEDPRDDIRRIAILAVARLAWYEFLPILAECAIREPNPQIRSELDDLAREMRARGPRPQVSPW